MIVVLGYYDKCNLGDEAYKIVMTQLLQDYGLPISFYNPYALKQLPPETRLVVCGGGDVIENWFRKRFDDLLAQRRCPCYAVSIGITYESTINRSFLGHFDRIWVRHQAYHIELAAVVGTRNLNHIPDITFLMTPASVLPQPQTKRIGVFLANGIESIVPHLQTALAKLLHTDQYKIVFYPFNTSAEGHEGDAFFVQRHFPGYELCPNQKVNTVEKMLQEMSCLHLAICVRYHSHIFSIIQNVPFVSLAMKPKVRFLMEDHGYSENVARQPSEAEIEGAIRYAMTHRTELKQKNAATYKLCNMLVQPLRAQLYQPNGVDELTDYAQRRLQDQQHSAESVVASILYHLTGSSAAGADYTYGFVENIKNNLHPLKDMISWVSEDFQSKMRTKLKLDCMRPPHTPESLCLLQKAADFGDVHRSGWAYTIDKLAEAFHSDNGVLCDTYVDATFLWQESDNRSHGLIPYAKPWIGFLHHTPIESCGRNNLIQLFQQLTFQLSLRTCKALITLSQATKKWIDKQLPPGSNVKVFVIKHPTETPPLKFEWQSTALAVPIVQIGAWLRDPYAIYRIKPSGFLSATKFVLQGRNMLNYMHPRGLSIRDGSKCVPGLCNVHVKHKHRAWGYECSCFENLADPESIDDDASYTQPSDKNQICRPPLGTHVDNICVQSILHWLWSGAVPVGVPDALTVLTADTQGCLCGNASEPGALLPKIDQLIAANFASVTTIPTLSNADYDELLSKSVVFIKLEDASAVNSIIECIVRNTPIIVNRLPAVVEYLGNKYPLYYDHINQVSTFTEHDIRAAHLYLKRMNKNDLSIESFLDKFKKMLKAIR